MTPPRKLSIVPALSLALVAGVVLLVCPRGKPAEPPEVPGQDVGQVRTRTPERAEAPAKDEGPAEPTGVEVAKAGWVITGRIVREGEGAKVVPVERVVVRLGPDSRRLEDAPQPQEDVTGADGRFEFAGVPGAIKLQLEIDDRDSARRVFGLELPDRPGEARRDFGDIRLEQAAGLVIWLAGPCDEPVKGATILATRRFAIDHTRLALLGLPERSSEIRPEERGKGEYVFERLPPGPYRVEVAAPGYARQCRPVELPRQEPVCVLLMRGLRISGTVCDPDGRPIEGAKVGGTRTDASGHFVIDTLRDGIHQVAASAEGFVSASKGGVMAGAENLQFLLVPEAVLAGKVVAEQDETPVAGAMVFLGSRRGGSFSALTDGQGLFEIRKIRPGTYGITARHADFLPGCEAAVKIREAERITGHIIRLRRGLTATIRVVDSETGLPIPEAEVSFRLRPLDGRGVPSAAAWTNSEGAFDIKGLAQGSCVLSLQVEGYVPICNRFVAITTDGVTDVSLSLRRGGSIS